SVTELCSELYGAALEPYVVPGCAHIALTSTNRSLCPELAPMAWMSGSRWPFASLTPLWSSSQSIAPSPSRSWTVVLKTTAAQDRQSYGEVLMCATFDVAAAP